MYSPSSNLTSILFKPFSDFFFSLLSKWITFIFWFSHVHYHEGEKCSFLTNDLGWFKNFNLAINYLLLSFDECSCIMINSFRIFFIFSLYAFLRFFKQSFLAKAKIYDKLILKLKAAEHCQHIPWSDYHLNHLITYHGYLS